MHYNFCDTYWVASHAPAEFSYRSPSVEIKKPNNDSNCCSRVGDSEIPDGPVQLQGYSHTLVPPRMMLHNLVTPYSHMSAMGPHYDKQSRPCRIFDKLVPLHVDAPIRTRQCLVSTTLLHLVFLLGSKRSSRHKHHCSRGRGRISVAAHDGERHLKICTSNVACWMPVHSERLTDHSSASLTEHHLKFSSLLIG